jgi:large subunit ribosomal protein L19
MNVVTEIGKELASVKRNVEFEVGDTVKVHYKIVEGNRERVQIYEGVVIAIDNKGAGKTFTVRRVSYDVGVERIFPVLSPRIAKIEVVRKGKTRRSKLYFLRERSGKSAKLRERLGVVIPATAAEPAAVQAEEAPKE